MSCFNSSQSNTEYQLTNSLLISEPHTYFFHKLVLSIPHVKTLDGTSASCCLSPSMQPSDEILFIIQGFASLFPHISETQLLTCQSTAIRSS